MTAVLAADQPQYDRAEQLKQLRRQMAAVSGKVGSSRRGHAHAPTAVADLLPDSQARLPVPQLLAGVCQTRCHGGRSRCCPAPGRCR